jgi:hypothetical protein
VVPSYTFKETLKQGFEEFNSSSCLIMDDGECIRMTGFDLVIIYNDILKKIELELIVNFHGLYFKMVCILNQILDSTFNINLTRKLD